MYFVHKILFCLKLQAYFIKFKIFFITSLNMSAVKTPVLILYLEV